MLRLQLTQVAQQQKTYTSLPSDASPSPFLTYHDYIKAYKEGRLTPSDVSEVSE